jgi:dUTP pyrophosphatase
MEVINIVNNTTHTHGIPSYATLGSAGMDLRSNFKGQIQLAPGEQTLIPTGINIALPRGLEAQIRPRSGLAFRHGITVLNSPGTIDSDYRGDIGIILINHGSETYLINHGDRIAQMVIAEYKSVVWGIVLDLPETERGEGGFGSTGKS